MSDPLWIGAGRGDSVGTATIATDGTFTITAHGLAEAQPVEVDNLTGGAVGVFRLDTTYYAINVQTDTFQVASVPGDVPITLGSSGGADVFTRVPHYNAGELRRAFSGLLWHAGNKGRFDARNGVVPTGALDNQVTVSGTTWTVDNLVAVVSVSPSVGGPYLVQHLAEAGVLDPADGSLSRTDALDLQVQDDDEDASGFHRARVVYVAGTPGGGEPALTATSTRLATILVPAGGSPLPSVLTQAPFTVAHGGIVPVRDQTELPTSGEWPGLAAYDRGTRALLIYDDGIDGWQSVAGPGVFPPTVQDIENTGFSFTNTAYDTTGGPVCGVAFTAPASGRVMLHYQGLIDMDSTGTSQSRMTPVVRTGGTVGSGTVILSADTDRAITTAESTSENTQSGGGSRARKGASHLVSGLIGGDTYNVQLEHSVTSGTGFLTDRSVQVVPAP